MHTRRDLALSLTVAATAVALTLPAEVRAQQSAFDQAESTFNKIRRDKVIRAAVYPGAEPYYFKDVATGTRSGAAIKMLTDIATIMDAKLEFLETSYGNSVLDLQANKIDLGIAMSATPRRALAVSFTNPYLVSCFGVIAKPNLVSDTWTDLNKPEVRIAIELGSNHEMAVRTFAPKAQISGFKQQPDLFLALQSNKVDCLCIAGLQGLIAAKKNPSLGVFRVVKEPLVELHSGIAVRSEPDVRWLSFLNTWISYNRATTQMRGWILEGLGTAGLTAADVPSQVLL